MKVLYLAGPYRSKDGLWGVHLNVELAKAVSRDLWRSGFAVLCPHANSFPMDGFDIPDETFLTGDLEMLSRCDAVVLVGAWRGSSGAMAEKEFAEYRGIPCFEWDTQRAQIYNMLIKD